MQPTSQTKSGKPQGRWWRWAKRMLWGVLALMALALVFHRPILRWTLNSLAPRLADSAGYELKWQVKGSVVSDLTVRDLELRGGDGATIKSVSIGELKADYSLWDLATKGTENFLDLLVASDVNVDVDLTAAQPTSQKPKQSDPLTTMRIPEVRLHNVDVKITTADGATQVKDLSLELSEGRSGILEIGELAHPGLSRPLTDIRGATKVEGHRVSLLDVEVAPEVTLARLEVSLEDLASGLPFDVDVRSGDGQLTASGELHGLGAKPVIESTATIQGVSDAEIRRWAPLPENIAWQIADANIKVEGPPGSPRELVVEFEAEGTVKEANGVPQTQVRIKAGLANGELKVPELSLTSAGGKVLLSGSASLPPAWTQMNRISAEAAWSIDAPNLANFVATGGPAITGSVHGSGSLAMSDGKLASATGTLEGRSVTYGTWRLDSIHAEVSSNAGEVQIKSVRAEIGEGNTLTIDGSIQTKGQQETKLDWAMNLGNPAAIAAMAGVKDASAIQADRFTGEGTARFEIAALRQKSYEGLKAEGILNVEGFAWGQRHLRDASLAFVQEGATLEVKALEAKFDDENIAHVSGQIQLEGKQELQAKWNLAIPRFEAISPWLQWNAGWPAITEGALNSKGQASATLADLRAKDFSKLTGSASASLSSIRTENRASLKAATVELHAENGRVDLKPVSITFDERNHVTASGHAMLAKPGEFALDVDADLPQLQALSGWVEAFRGPAIRHGSALVSWHGEGTISTGDIQGHGSVSLSEVKLADRPEFSVTLATSHAGRKAEITELTASSGNFRLAATATVTPTDLSVPSLSAFSGDTLLASGSVAIPLSLGKKAERSLPLDPGRPMDVSLNANNLDLTTVFESFGAKAPVSGIVSGEVSLHGPLGALQGSVHLQADKATAKAVRGKLKPATVQLDATLANNQLQFQIQVEQVPLRTLSVTGNLPFDAEKLVQNPSAVMDAPIEAHLLLPESDLAIVRRFVPAIAELQGTVKADVDVRGPLRSPHWSGALTASAPRMVLEKSPMDIQDLRLRLTFQDKRLQLDEASVILAGGTLRGSGEVDLTDIANPAVDLHLVASQALIVRDETMSARADGDIECKGTLKQAAVTGRVQLVRCRVFKEIEYLPLSLPNQLPPPPPPVEARAPPQLPPPFHEWTFDVDIVTRDAIRLLGNVFNGSATADLHLGGTGAEPELVGEVSFAGARVRLPNSRLTITRGTLIFTEDKPFEPEIDAQGESLVGSYEVIVHAYGSALSPKVRFSSSPPLPENEIATLLATGSTAGDERSAASVAASNAAFMLLSKAYRSIFDKAAPKRYDEEPPRLTFGFSPLSTGTSQPGVSATYEISPRIQATGAVTERGTFRGMLYYMLRLR